MTSGRSNWLVRSSRTAICAAVLVGATALVTNQVVSQEKKGGQAGAGHEMSDEMKAMMAKFEELARPGPQHKALDALAGNWKADVKSWMEPGKAPETSTGSESSKWLHGNRHLFSEFQGSMMGQPFTGTGLSGFDNQTKKYYMVWVDSCGTAPMLFWGTADAAGKTFTYTGECNDCMTGQPKKMKAIMRIISNSEHSFEMLDTGPDGKEFKCMEIRYTRK